MDPASHQIWACTAGAHIRTLCELKRHEQAVACGDTCLSIAEQKGLGYLKNYVLMPLALALSALGEHARAAETARSAIDDFQRLGTTSLNLAVAYETRARVALQAGDRAGFERFAALSATQLQEGLRRMAGAKYERLVQSEAQDSSPPLEDDHAVISELSATLRSFTSRSDRARSGIAMLARKSGAIGGLLYENQQDGSAIRPSAAWCSPASRCWPSKRATSSSIRADSRRNSAGSCWKRATCQRSTSEREPFPRRGCLPSLSLATVACRLRMARRWPALVRAPSL
jgi:hypothetical protein